MKDVVPRRAWLLLAAGDSRGHGGNFGYDDQIDAYYSWDSNVQNHKSLAVGDPVALWDKERLLGVSVIEEIRKSPGVKALNRCPRCNLTRIDDRKTSEPRYRCRKCHAEFATPHLDIVEVLEYKARYDAAWTSLDGVLDGSELRTLVTNVRSFNSIRALDWSAFRRALIAKEAGRAVARVNERIDFSWPSDSGAPASFPQGFSHALVRVRRGQQQFRERLLESQGSICA
ncbi:MAG: hypothetical protein L6311_00790, partial [Cellulomonas sp.]|nr:hypothetical protein [Cellulomonas sp.]